MAKIYDYCPQRPHEEIVRCYHRATVEGTGQSGCVAQQYVGL